MQPTRLLVTGLLSFLWASLTLLVPQAARAVGFQQPLRG